MTTEDQWNQINGGQSALGEGTFKRRDELRRAESMQRQKIKMAERLDRNISRAVRKGDARSASAFNNLRGSITGQGFQGAGGITNSDDREQRVRDGTIKGAKIRYDMGNIGSTNNGMIAEAPPEDSVTPKDRGLEGAGLTPDSPTSPSSGIYESDIGRNLPGAAQKDVKGTPEAPQSVQTTPVAPRSQTNIGGLQKKREAVAKLRDKWTSQNKANDVNSLVADYEAKNGDPADQAQPYREEFGQSDGKVDKAIAGLDPSKFSPEQIASIRKNMAGLSPQERKDSVKEGKDATSWKTFEAKQRAAEKSGYKGEVVASTNFGEEAKALIPGAKKELQSRIDQADIMTGSTQDAFGDFENLSRSLKDRRGAPSISEAQSKIVSDGSIVQNRGGVELDSVIPSGNPLFDGVLDGSIKASPSRPKPQREIGGQPAASVKNLISINDDGIAGTAGKFAGNNLGLAKKYYGGVLGAAGKSAGFVAGKSADIASRYYGGLWNNVLDSGSSFFKSAIKSYNEPNKNPVPR